MSNLIVILGESGTGKSTSMRNLDPKSTFIINVLNKPLPFRGYKKHYNKESKNYLESDQYPVIMKWLEAINKNALHIKTIVIDDYTFLMNNQYMRRCREKSFEKFNDIGINQFEIFELASTFRDDLYCYIMCHTEKDHAGIIKPRTVGKMTGDYVGIAERVSIVLHSQIVDMQYKFLTQNDGYHVAKSSMGMFSDLYIDNDLAAIRETIDNYYNGNDESNITCEEN